MSWKKRAIAYATTAVLGVGALIAPFSFIPDKEVTAETSFVNYAKALQYSLYLFDANMCGTDVEEKADLAWRGDCHVYDADKSVNINGTEYSVDVSGGYHDAGDHMKFSLPAGESFSSLNLAYYKFADAFEKTGQTEHLKTILEREADYLKRCIVRDASGKIVGFVVQVGDNTSDAEGNADHRSSVAPEVQPDNKRDVIVATSSNPCSDEVYVSAAVLAGYAVNFGDDEAKQDALDLYNFAESNQKSMRVCPFYTSGDWDDDRSLAQSWLNTAGTGVAYTSVKDNWVPNWDNTGAFASAVQGSLSGLASYTISNTVNGFDFIDKWGSLRLACNAQFVRACAGQELEKTQQLMDFIYGNNSQNICFQIGYANNSSKNAHHRAAAPGMMVTKNVLVGAMVGGPESFENATEFTYNDEVSNYVGNEVALDYQAGFVGCLAALMSTYGTSDQIGDYEAIPGVRGMYAASGPAPTTPASVETLPAGVETSIVSSVNSSVVSSIVTSQEATGGSSVKTLNPNKELTFNGDDVIYTVMIADLMGPNDTLASLEFDITAVGDVSYSGAIAVAASYCDSPLYGGEDGTWPALIKRLEQEDTGWALDLPDGKNTFVFEIPEEYRKNVSYTGDVQLHFWYSNDPGSTVVLDEVRATLGGGEKTVTSITSYVSSWVESEVVIVGGGDTKEPETTPATAEPSTPAPGTPAPGTPAPGTPAPGTPAPGDDVTVCGDVDLDGEPKISDLVALCKHVVGVVGANLTGTALANADCDDNGVVDANDALTLAKYIVKKISALPYAG
jgi:hypothetical protein